MVCASVTLSVFWNFWDFWAPGARRPPRGPAGVSEQHWLGSSQQLIDSISSTTNSITTCNSDNDDDFTYGMQLMLPENSLLPAAPLRTSHVRLIPCLRRARQHQHEHQVDTRAKGESYRVYRLMRRLMFERMFGA